MDVPAAEFTPVASTLGGLLIGTAATLVLALQGRIAGISGILGGILRSRDRPWRIAFVLGLLGGGLVAYTWAPQQFGAGPSLPPVGIAIAGLLVGYGTRLGSGCTSGHGVCGMSRLSRRSIAATGIFMVVAAITVWVARHVGGAPS